MIVDIVDDPIYVVPRTLSSILVLQYIKEFELTIALLFFAMSTVLFSVSSSYTALLHAVQDVFVAIFLRK